MVAQKSEPELQKCRRKNEAYVIEMNIQYFAKILSFICIKILFNLVSFSEYLENYNEVLIIFTSTFFDALYDICVRHAILDISDNYVRNV